MRASLIGIKPFCRVAASCYFWAPMALLLFLLAGASSAQAITLDLITDTEGFINGALFTLTDESGSGSGALPSFVRLSGGGIVEGYNTTVGGVFDNTNDATHNHEITLAEIPLLTIDGTDYREFLLDINEPGQGNPDRVLSLDEIQIFVSDIANQSTESFSGAIVDLTANPPKPLYRLDAGTDSLIKLDASISAGGSGQTNMFAYIPDSLFPGTGSQFVYLYSHFGGLGGNFANHGGFEEWALRVVENPPCEQLRPEEGCDGDGGEPIPEPSSLLLIGSGLGLLALRRKRTR